MLAISFALHNQVEFSNAFMFEIIAALHSSVKILLILLISNSTIYGKQHKKIIVFQS